MKKIKIPGRILVVLFWSAVILTFSLLHFFNIDFSFLNFDPCTLKSLTGLSCVACGGTRATICLSHFNLKDAFLFNPLYILLLLIGSIYAIVITIDVLVHGKKTLLLNEKATKVIIFTLIAIGIVFTILRNTPFYLNWFYV